MQTCFVRRSCDLFERIVLPLAYQCILKSPELPGHLDNVHRLVVFRFAFVSAVGVPEQAEVGDDSSVPLVQNVVVAGLECIPPIQHLA